MENEKNEIDQLKRHQKEEARAIEKFAAEALIKSGEEWIKRNTPNQFESEMMGVRAFLTAWNQLNGTTIPFSLQTIEVMMATVANLPITAHFPQLAANLHYKKYYEVLSAVRNHLRKQRDEKLKNSGMPPELLTPGAETSKPML